MEKSQRRARNQQNYLDLCLAEQQARAAQAAGFEFRNWRQSTFQVYSQPVRQ